MHCRLSFLILIALIAAAIPPASTASRQQKPQSGKPQQPPPKPRERVVIETHFVTVNVKVVDDFGRFVVGLKKEDFEIYDNEIKQEVAQFSDEDTPISVGFVYDVSGSMNGLSARAFALLRQFFDYSHNEDEYFIMAFNNKPRLVQDFTSLPEEIINRMIHIPAKGSTSLYDAVYLAAEKVKQGRHQKKALLIFSDGEENSSRYSGKELANLLKETDIQIYTVGMDQLSGGGAVLRDLSEPTGGLAGFPMGFAEAEHFYARLALLLRRQYVLGFYPTDTSKKKAWHKLHVKLNAPKQMRRLTLSYRKGYPAF